MKPIDYWCAEDHPILTGDIDNHITAHTGWCHDTVYELRRLIMTSIRQHIKDDLKAGKDTTMKGINNER